MAERILTPLHLNRALLARQLLLERAEVSVERAVELVGSIQTQYAPSGYVGLWSRVAGFRREDLTRALEQRIVVQGTLQRSTIHLISAREYWLYAAGVRRARQEWWLRLRRGGGSAAAEWQTRAAEQERRAAGLTAALADGPRSVAQLGALGGGFIGNLALWVDIVRVPPSGTWERRRADNLALAEQWDGPQDATEEEGLEHLVRAYLRGYGPAPYRDISTWAGVPVVPLRAAGERLDLRTYRDEDGKELLDLPDAPLPDPDTPAPVRFVPHWDANLLVHARRARIIDEVHRPHFFSSKNPFSAGAILVDGRVVGNWNMKKDTLMWDLFEALSSGDERDVRDEAARLEAFHTDT